MINVQSTVACTAVGYFQGKCLHKSKKIHSAYTLHGLALALVTDGRRELALLPLGPGGWGQGVWWSFQCQHHWGGTPCKTSSVLVVSFWVIPHGIMGVPPQHWVQLTWDPKCARHKADPPQCAPRPEAHRGCSHLF